MAGVIGLVATVVARSQPAINDRRTVEELLDRWATIALAWFFLSDDKNWWFAADRSAVLAYKVVGSTAVVLGEPVGSPEGCRAATEQLSRVLRRQRLDGRISSGHRGGACLPGAMWAALVEDWRECSASGDRL